MEGGEIPPFLPPQETHMPNIDLLDRVQAADGWFAVLGIKGKSVRQVLVQTREELNKAAAEFVEQKRNAYFGCAKFTTDKNRTKDNVQNIKCFWLDIDCGESKTQINETTGRPDGYIDQEAGLKELKRFCDLIGLPRPLLVNSGRGIHAYWPLSAPVTRAEWEPVANRFNELCILHKFYVDTSVFEVSRVLRIPGTFNFKDEPPSEVTIISDCEDIEYTKFRDLLGVKELKKIDAPKQELSELAKSLLSNTTISFSRIMRKSANGEGCAQLLHAYQNQDSISEPLWWDALSVAHLCVDRATAIHKISDQHPEYDYEDTESKASTTSGAHHCTTFEKHNPGGCEGCPWKGRIKTPLSLGREIVRPEKIEEPKAVLMDGGGTYVIPTYPFPFFRGKNGGVYIAPPKEDSEAEATCVYEHDIYVVKRMRDPEEGELALLRLHLPRDEVFEFTVPLATIAVKESLRSVLAEKGVAGLPKQMEGLTTFIMMSVKELQYKAKAEKMRTQFGWADNDSKIIIGNREITKDGTYHSPPSKVTQQFAEVMSAKGTLEKWKEVFNMYSKPGMEAHAFGALTAFGAPLLKFTGHNGAIINLIHKNSGTGKSTVLYMANSVYGHPEKLAAIWKDTLLAKMLHLGVMNNLPFTVDEVTNISPADFSTLAYSMSQGRGPNRVKSQSNELRQNNTTWQTISLASSNASFYEKLGLHKNSPDGEMMRLLEYRIEPNDVIPPEVAKHMFDHQLRENYGIAGDIYCGHLVNNLEESVSGMLAVQAKIDKEMRLTAKERFWSSIISCNITGGLIARNLNLIDYDMRAVYKYAMGMLQELREDVKPPVSDASGVIGDFINRHMQNILVVDDEVDKRSNLSAAPTLEPRNELIIRYEPDTKKMYIAVGAFRKDCAEGQVHYKDVLQQLKNKGVYVGSMNKRLSKGMKISSPGVHCLIFDCSGSDFIDVEGFVNASVDSARRAD